MTDTVVAPILLLLITLGLLTWWAVARPNRVSVRAWSVGVWASAVTVVLIAASMLLADGLISLAVSAWAIITGGLVLAVLLVASPFLAWAAFLLGQRWFVERRGQAAPTTPG